MSSLYSEAHRPHIHFSPPTWWMNDPNGMFYYEGEYHLFYQYHPGSTVWGPMHWGHAVSQDLVHWEHLPIALYPDELGDIFSGSAVVDWNNSSGFGDGSEPPILAVFTYHNREVEVEGVATCQTQGIAYSLDRGRSWIKYEHNPVIANPGHRDFRDPKVFWHAPTERWIMVLAVGDHVQLFASTDLKTWERLSEFGKQTGAHGGVWECPDLFPLPVEGHPKLQKWVLLVSVNPGGPHGGSATQYFVGEFDGHEFVVDEAFAAQLTHEPMYVPEGEMFADFEHETYRSSNVEGDAFGEGPILGEDHPRSLTLGFSGKRLVGSGANGDEATGTLTSPSFTIQRDFINFQIAGGNHAHQTCLNLLVDGQVARTQTGLNRERLFWTGWDVRDLVGKEARLQVVDQHSGLWGHVLVDQIMFADELARPRQDHAKWLDYGMDNYAGVSWSDVPEADGRRLFVGWMSNWQYAQNVPTAPWRSAMTLVRSLSLHPEGETHYLYSHPIEALKQLRKEEVDLEPLRVTGDDSPRQHSLELTLPMEIWLELETTDLPDSGCFGIHLSNKLGERVRLGYDLKQSAFFMDRREAGRSAFSDEFADIFYARAPKAEPAFTLHLYIDHASVELFAEGGRVCMTNCVFPSEDYSRMELFAEGTELQLTRGKAWPLASIWEERFF